MKRTWTGVAVLTILLTGCSGPAPAATPTPTELGAVATIDELRDAYVAAGGECEAWEQTNVVTLAAESGQCSDSVTLSTFTSEADRDQLVSDIRGFSDMIGMSLLVGPNWVVNSKDIEDVQPAMGGTPVVKAPTK